MKYFLVFLIGIVLLNTGTLHAQFNEKPIINLENEDKAFLNWGYYLGFNQFDFKFEYKNDLDDILVEKSIGFNVGLIGEMRINEFFDLRFEPGLFYTTRTLGYKGFADTNDAIREIKSTYISFPLLIKSQR